MSSRGGCSSLCLEIPGNTPERARYFVRRLTEGIGTSPAAWEIAWGLLETFEGSMSDLVAMTRRLVAVTQHSPTTAP
jgi:hypothetical protein